MCGLTGFAVHPAEGDLNIPRSLLPDMLRSIEHRGHDATGIAAVGGTTDFIFKVADTASAVTRSAPFQKALADITDHTIVLGHTRHAFVPAGADRKTDDESAHPFQIGRVIGAHNGVIRNWRQIETRLKPKSPWRVDSQAIFGLLDHHRKPIKALNQLDGYFALSWTKEGALYLARSEAAPLYVAYVGVLRLLLWHSVSSELERLIESFGATKDDFALWETMPGRVYRYDPTKFTDQATGVERMDGSFAKGWGQGQRWPSADQRRLIIPSGVGLTSTPPTRADRTISYGYSRWDPVRALEVPTDIDTPHAGRRSLPPGAGRTPGERAAASRGRSDGAVVTLRELEQRLAALTTQVENLRRATEVIFRLLEDANIIDGLDSRIARYVDDDEEEDTATEDTATEDAAQGSLFLEAPPTEGPGHEGPGHEGPGHEGPVCVECGGPEAQHLPGGQFVTVTRGPATMRVHVGCLSRTGRTTVELSS